MEESDIVKALAALAQPIRLQVFRALVVAGQRGMVPSTMAEGLGISPSSLSFHLKELVHAGLVTQERASRMGGVSTAVFWRKWDRDPIIASGIAAPLEFITRTAKVGVLKCSSITLDASRLCVSQPYAGGWVYSWGASWQPRQMGALYNPYTKEICGTVPKASD